MVGDATGFQAILCTIGFIALVLIPIFEFDVSTNSFLEEKLSVTNCFLRMLGADKLLNREWSQYSSELLKLVSESPDLAPMYEEVHSIGTKNVFPSMLQTKFILHMSGAGIYIGCVSAAIVLNDYNDIGVPITSMLFMNAFAIITQLCGKLCTDILSHLRRIIYTISLYLNGSQKIEALIVTHYILTNILIYIYIYIH